MTINELSGAGITLEGKIIINRYHEETDDVECIAETEPGDSVNVLSAQIRERVIKYMYATTWEKPNGTESACMVIEFE